MLSPQTIAEQDDTTTGDKNEAVSVVTATVPLAAGTAFTVTVSATPAGGYTLSADRVLTFEANATVSTGAVTITAEDNSTEDGDKTVTVSGEVPETGVAIAPDNQTLTITDDEGLPKVALVLTPVTVEEADDEATTGENEAQAKVTARLQKAHNAAFTVTVSAAAVLPAEAGDFRLSDNPVLTFAAGATDSTGSVTVTAVDNDVDEQEKQVTVSGTVSVAATAVRPPNARTLTITDDDLPAVTIAAGTGSVTEGANAVFELTRAGVITKALTVTVQVTQSGAFLKAPADYTEAVQAVFNAGSETTTLTAATEGDETDEANGSITATVTAAASDAAYRVGTESSAKVTVEDDDLPTVTLVLSPPTIAEQDDTATNERDESVSVVTATVPLAAGTAFTVTVSATPAGGYTLSENRVLTFEANATESTGAVTVTAENNDVDAADKTVTVSGTVSNSAVANAPAAQTLTITDDDLPKVTIAAGTSPVTEGTNAVFELTRVGVITEALTVAVGVTQSGTFIRTSDGYTAPQQVVFPAESDTAGLTVATEGDDTDEVNGSVTATVSTGDGYRVGTKSSAKVTVEDDDLPTVELVLSQQTIAEQDDTTTTDKNELVSVVTATVPLAASTPFTVTVSATPAGGYTLSADRVLTFAANATGSTGLVTVTAVNDDVDTADKTVTVSGTVSNSAVANAPAAQTLTITDDDLPKVTIAAGTSPVTEGANAVFELTRAGVITEALTVAVGVTQSGTFIKTSDGYTAPTSAVFNAGSNTTTLTVETQGDETDEANGSVTATVSTGEGYRLGTESSAEVTVEDDDLPTVELVLSPSTIAERDDTATEKNEAQTVVTATVPLAADTAFTVTVSATPAGGYTSSADRVLTFEANATVSTGAVTITAEDNSTEDGDKTVTVSGAVSNPAVAIAPDAQTLTITDDEGLPKVALVLTPVTVEEADDTTTDGENEAQAKVTATLQKAHNAAFTVTVSAAAVLPAEAGDFRLSDNPVLTFAAGATESTGSVTVTAVDNDVDEQEKQVTVSGTVSVAATAVRAPNARTLTITDDDLPAVTIAAETSPVTEGANAVFELTRAGVITKALTVTVGVTQSGAFLKAPADYTEAVQAVFNAGSETTTLTVETEGDATDEANGSITATVTADSDAAYRLGTDSSAAVTVKDDDLPKVTLVLRPDTIAENGTVSRVTATVPRAAGTAFTVTVSATPAGGFTLSADPVLTFEAQATGSTGAVTVTAVNDDVDAENKQVAVSGAVSNAAVANAPDDVTLTITDDDLPVVTIAAGTSPVTESADAVFTLTRAGVTTAALAVAVEVTQSGAFLKTSAGYTAPTRAVFNAGSATTTLTVETQGDATDEADGSITATVTADSGAAYRVGTDSSDTVTVKDDDLPVVTLVLRPDTIAENGTVSTVTATVPRAAGTAFTVTVSATPAGGFTLSTNRVLSFAAGATGSTGAVTVTAVDDEVDTEDKQVTVSGAVPGTGVAIAPDDQTLTITDDDQRGVRVQPTSLAFSEGGASDYTVALMSQPTATVTIAVALAAGSDPDVSVNPSALTFGTGDWNGRQTVHVSAVHDTGQENDAATVEHTASGGDYAGHSVSPVRVTVYDDEGVPEAPRNFRAEANHVDRVHLTWFEPRHSGGGRVTGYRIEVSEDGVSWDDLVVNTSSLSITYTHHGLEPGETRHYRVSAINRAGPGPPSDPARATTRWGSLPVVSLEHVADSVREGSPVEIRLRRDRTAEALQVEVSVSETGSMLAHRASHLHMTTFAAGAATAVLTVATVDDATVEPASVLTAYLLTRNRPYNRDPKRWILRMTLLDNDAALVPLAPDLQAEPGDGQVRLSWTPAANGGDQAIVRYEHRHRNRGRGDSWSGWTAVSGAAAARSVTVEGLENGFAYDLEVRAVTGAGNGAAARRTVTVQEPRLDVPDAPVVEAIPGDGRVALRWAAAKDNGSPIVRYERRYREAGGQWPEPWTEVDGGPAARGESMNGMQNGMVYEFKVRAVNGQGEGRFAQLRVMAGEPERRPGPPQQLEAVAVGAEAMRLSWAAPADRGHPELTGYRIERTGRYGWHTVMEPANPDTTTWTDSGLAAGVTYRYRVAAVNEDGAGPWSEVAAATTGMPAGGGICDRTAAVRDWIMVWLEAHGRASDCATVTATDLKTVTHLGLQHRVYDDGSQTVVTTLKAGDFAGLPSMRSLTITGHEEFRTLPAGVFAGLAALETLELDDNALEALPSGVFDDLVSLRRLSLRNNRLRSFPFQELERLPHLTELSIDGNPGTADPGVEATPATVTVSAGGTSSYRLRLTRYPSTTGITVTVSSSDGAVTVSPDELKFTHGNWWRRQEVTVSASAAASGEVTLSQAYTGGFYTLEEPPGVKVLVTAQSRTRRAQAPRVAATAVTSGPGQNGIWDEGETVTAEVRFSSAVTVDTAGGVPTLGITLDGTPGEAAYHGGSGTPVLTFMRQVTEAEAGARKARVAANSLALNGGAIGASGVAAQLGFAVAPYVTGVEVAPDATGDGAWTAGDTVTVRVRFSESVTVEAQDGGPKLVLQAAGAKDAPYAGGTGTPVLEFGYAVTAGDGELTAVLVVADSLSLGEGTMRGESGLDAKLAHGSASGGASSADDPVLTAEGAAVREGSGVPIDFVVRLNDAASEPVRVSYATADGTATAGADYEAAAGTLTFAPGDTAKTVSVAVLDDAVDEARETLWLVLYGADGARLGDATALGTIVNTDPVPRGWLARFGRTAAGHVLAAVQERLSAAGQSQATMAGQRLERLDAAAQAAAQEAYEQAWAQRLQEGHLQQVPRSVELRELWAGSSFALTAGAAPGAGSAAAGGGGGRWSVWGRGAWSGSRARTTK